VKSEANQMKTGEWVKNPKRKNHPKIKVSLTRR